MIKGELPIKIPVFIFSTRNPPAFLKIVHQNRLILVADVLYTSHRHQIPCGKRENNLEENDYTVFTVKIPVS